ncbi:MAG: OmpA family protein [Akkermansiaceae bacterium]
MQILTFFTIAGLFMIGQIAMAADTPEIAKLRKDRQRLIDLVINLEADFSKTLENFDQLHTDYAALLAKPQIPDQRGHVKSLEKQLVAAAAKIREMERLEKKNTADRDAKLLALKKAFHNQIDHLKADLTRERAAIKLAQTQLGEVRTLQIEARKVEKMLRTEIIGRSELQAQVQTLRGERDALLLRLTESMTQLGKAKESFADCEARIAGLERSSRELKTSLAQRDAEITELKKLALDRKKLASLVENLETKKSALNERLAKQRPQIESLRKEAARAKMLTTTVQRLEADQKSYLDDIKTRDSQLMAFRQTGKKNKELLAAIKKLEDEKGALGGLLQKRVKEIARFRKQLLEHRTMAEKLALAERGMTVNKAKIRDAQQEITSLEGALEAEKKVSDEHLAKLKEVTEKNRAFLLKVVALEKDKTRLQNELSKRETVLKRAITAVADQSSVQEAQQAATEAMAKIKKEKKNLDAQLAKRDADLKKARMDLGKLHLESEATKKQMHALKVRFAKVAPVRYALGVADVRDQQARVLRDVQEVRKMFPNARFEIVGHTCDLGSQQRNRKLSQDRAASLKEYLSQNGIKAGLLTSRGVADAEPLVPNTNESNRRRNRRVEIHILD